MSVTPYICDSCENAEEGNSGAFSISCRCGGVMVINYQDNYKEDHDHTPCNGCLYLRVGAGEKCSYCNRI